MELKKFIFCAYLLFLIFPMSIKGQESTSNNYIIVKYSDEVENEEYANGFSIDNIPSRKGVNYIIKGNSRYKSIKEIQDIKAMNFCPLDRVTQ